MAATKQPELTEPQTRFMRQFDGGRTWVSVLPGRERKVARNLKLAGLIALEANDSVAKLTDAGKSLLEPAQAISDLSRFPTPSLLVKLGSIAVHIEEWFSPHGHPVDKHTIEQLLRDPEVVEWRKAMGPMLPVKRNK